MTLSQQIATSSSRDPHAPRFQLKRRITSTRRPQDFARSFVGDVATPNKSPDRVVSAAAYQAESGDGNMPNVRSSCAMVRSGVPSGNRSRTAKPVAMTLSASKRSRSCASNSPRLAA